MGHDSSEGGQERQNTFRGEEPPRTEARGGRRRPDDLREEAAIANHYEAEISDEPITCYLMNKAGNAQVTGRGLFAPLSYCLDSTALSGVRVDAVTQGSESTSYFCRCNTIKVLRSPQNLKACKDTACN